MKKLFAFQKDKNRLELLFLHIAKEKISLRDYRQCEAETKDKVLEFIKGFISDNKIAAAQTVCFLPLSAVYLRKITFPYRRISKIRKSIRFAVEPHIPVPVEDTRVFFYPLNAKNNNLEVMTFVVPEVVLNDQLELINSAELTCNEIYLTPLSLFNFFSSHTQPKENILWLHVGEDSAYISFVSQNKKLTDLREVPIGRKNLNQERAELKREISTVLLSQGSESAENGIKEIYISGVPVSPQEETPEICSWLTENFNISAKAVEFNDFLSVEQSVPSDAVAAPEGNVRFTPDILYAGCAVTGPVAINFYPPRYHIGEKERKNINLSFSLAALVLIILSFRLQFERNIYEKKFNLLNSRIEKIFLEAFPEAEDTRTPLLQFKSRINSLKESTTQPESISSSPLEVLREISQGIDKNLQVKLDSFRLKEDDIIISGSASSSSDIDKIKENLEKSPLFSGVDVEIQRTDKGVTFRLKISHAEGSKE